MADEPNPNDGGGNDLRQMRDALARKDARINELTETVSTFRSAALAGVAHQAGFDPTAGPVKLVMEKFEADLTPDKLTPDAFKTFAEEWQVSPTTTSPQVDTSTTPSPSTPSTPPAEQTTQTRDFVQSLQTPADQLAAAANANSHLNTDPTSTVAQITAAQSEGRWGDSFALKVASATTPPDGTGTQQGQLNPSTGLPTHTPAQ